MTQLQMSICLLLDTFQKYASEDGKSSTLSKAETKKLLENELPEMLTGAKDKDVVDKLIKDLDVDGDGEVCFMEFMILVASLACAFRGCMESLESKQKKK